MDHLNDNMTIRDLNGEEIAFLLRYRLLPDKDKEKLSRLMKELKTDNSNEK